MSYVRSSTVMDTTISATTNTPAGLVTTGQCSPGFVKCTDGRCEPFELLCENGVASTLPTRPTEPKTSTIGAISLGPLLMSTSISQTTLLPSNKVTSPYVSLSPGNIAVSTATHVVTVPPQVGGQCHVGFVQCTDGRCEPFEQLCGEAGFVTLPTRKPEMTTSTTGPLTNSQGVIITSPTGPPPSTLPTTIVTLRPLDNGCPPGFELCPDKKCEPFHFMCEEHITSEVVG